MPYDEIPLEYGAHDLRFDIGIFGNGQQLGTSATRGFRFTLPERVEFSRIWADHGQYEHGRAGMQINVGFTVRSMKDKHGSVCVYFYDAKGKNLKDRNRQYSTSDGKVATHGRFTPDSKIAEYSDFSVFMPYEELHLTGAHNLQYSVSVLDENNREIRNSGMQKFNIR